MWLLRAVIIFQKGTESSPVENIKFCHVLSRNCKLLNAFSSKCKGGVILECTFDFVRFSNNCAKSLSLDLGSKFKKLWFRIFFEGGTYYWKYLPRSSHLPMSIKRCYSWRKFPISIFGLRFLSPYYSFDKNFKLFIPFLLLIQNICHVLILSVNKTWEIFHRSFEHG